MHVKENSILLSRFLALRERFPVDVEWFDPELVPSEFLSTLWREGRSDLIVKIRARHRSNGQSPPAVEDGASTEITVFIIGEHQTTQPLDVMLRFLGYFVEALRNVQKANKGPHEPEQLAAIYKKIIAASVTLQNRQKKTANGALHPDSGKASRRKAAPTDDPGWEAARKK